MTGNDMCEYTVNSTAADRLDRAFFLNCAVEVLSNIIVNTRKSQGGTGTGKQEDVR